MILSIQKKPLENLNIHQLYELKKNITNKLFTLWTKYILKDEQHIFNLNLKILQQEKKIYQDLKQYLNNINQVINQKEKLNTMETTNTILNKYEIGKPVFNKLFNLTKPKLIEVLKQICYNYDYVIKLLNNNCSVKKEIYNDEPLNIIISYYDSMEITPLGITYKPEHDNPKHLIEFNQFFTIDTIKID